MVEEFLNYIFGIDRELTQIKELRNYVNKDMIVLSRYFVHFRRKKQLLSIDLRKQWDEAKISLLKKELKEIKEDLEKGIDVKHFIAYILDAIAKVKDARVEMLRRIQTHTSLIVDQENLREEIIKKIEGEEEQDLKLLENKIIGLKELLNQQLKFFREKIWEKSDKGFHYDRVSNYGIMLLGILRSNVENQETALVKEIKEILTRLVNNIARNINDLIYEKKLEEEVLKRELEKRPYRLRVDLHFHPQLPADEEGATKKARAILNKIKRLGINVIVTTEHAYIDSERDYKLMMLVKESDFKDLPLIILPGIECITKNNIEIIVFSKYGEFEYNLKQIKQIRKYYSPGDQQRVINYLMSKKVDIYEEKRLLDALRYNVKEILLIAQQRGFGVFFPHPYSFVKGIIEDIDHEKVIRELAIENIRERYNRRFNPSELAQEIENVKKRLRHDEYTKERVFQLMEKEIARIVKTYNVGISVFSGGLEGVAHKANTRLLARSILSPTKRLVDHFIKPVISTKLRLERNVTDEMKKVAKFHGGGLDAHGPDNLGISLEIPISKDPAKMSREEVFDLITSNKILNIPSARRPLTLKEVFTALLECAKYGSYDTRKWKKAHEKRNKKIEEETKKLVRVIKNPKSDINEVIDILSRIPDHEVLLKVWRTLTKEEKEKIISAQRKILRK